MQAGRAPNTATRTPNTGPPATDDDDGDDDDDHDHDGDDDHDHDHDDADDDDADDDDDHLRVACYLGAPVSHVTPGRACHMLPRGEQCARPCARRARTMRDGTGTVECFGGIALPASAGRPRVTLSARST